MQANCSDWKHLARHLDSWTEREWEAEEHLVLAYPICQCGYDQHFVFIATFTSYRQTLIKP